MAMFVPHISREGIQTTNAGQAANYRGAGEFMSPGQSAMPGALQGLAQSLGQLGNTMFNMEVQDRQQALDVAAMRAVQSAQLQDEEWRAQYQQDYTGEAARSAATDYLAHTKKTADALTLQFQHNPQALKYVEGRLHAMALSGVKGMRSYAEQQGIASLKALADEKGASLLAMAENPDPDPAMFRQAVEDFNRPRLQLYQRQGHSAESAAVMVRQDLRKVEQIRAKHELARLRVENPAAGLALVGRAMQGVDKGPAAFVAELESGPDGSRAIGYDRTGGTSYGKFQLSSKTMEKSFLPWLEQHGHKAAAEELRNAGPANTGGKDGAMPNAWKALVESGAITDNMQEAFIRETHVTPALQKAPEDLRRAAGSDPMLAAAVFDTAVQHGAGSAGKLLSGAWESSGGDPDAFVENLYESRKGQFSSSTLEVREAVAARLDQARDKLLSKDFFEATRLREALSPADLAAYHQTLQADTKAQQKLAEDRTATEAFNGILARVEPQTPEVQDMLAAEAITALPPGDMQNRVRKNWEEYRKIRDTAVEAKDAALTAAFLEDMRGNNLNAPAAVAYLPELRKNGMSTNALDTLRKRLEKGDLDKETDANKARTNEAYRLIDQGGVTMPEQLDVWAFRHGMTKKQADGLKEYLSMGGQPGAASMIWSKVNTAYKNMVPDSKGLDDDSDFMTRFMKSADMEKLHREGEAYVRRHTANLLVEGEETRGFLWDSNMSYAEAIGKGKADQWFPAVSADEERRYTSILQSMGVKKRNKAEWKQAVREYKKYDVMGLPRPQRNQQEGQ